MDSLFTGLEHLRQSPAVLCTIADFPTARKSTIRAALVLGSQVGLTYTYLVGVHLLRRLPLEGMAAIISRSLGLALVPAILERPEITLDVDEPWSIAIWTI